MIMVRLEVQRKDQVNNAAPGAISHEPGYKNEAQQVRPPK